MSSNGSLDCHSFEDRIHQILDDRLTLTGDDLLMAHAARCADCEKILMDYDSVDDSVKLLPADIAKILSAADARSASSSLASRQLAILAALAAMIVIALNVIQGMNDNPSNRTPSIARVSVAPAIAPQFSVASHSSGIGMLVPSSPIHPNRPTPDTSPFSKNFSMASSIPSISLPTVPTWNEIAHSLDPLEPVLTYSSRIPAVRPVHCSFNVTIELLKQSFSKSERKPDLGYWMDPNMLAAV